MKLFTLTISVVCIVFSVKQSHAIPCTVNSEDFQNLYDLNLSIASAQSEQVAKWADVTVNVMEEDKGSKVRNAYNDYLTKYVVKGEIVDSIHKMNALMFKIRQQCASKPR